MNEIRSQRAKVNIVTTFINQLVSMLCGVVIPRIMIGAFGSTVYGATTSISQFLSYISLLEGGIGRVARGALYKPLAQNDNLAISKVYYTTKRFFRIVGMVFIIYVLVVAIVYYDIADITEFSRQFTFLLVIVISISGLAKYLGGLANLTLINADQKQYITNLIISITTVVNTILIVVLVNLECDVLIVKFVSSCIFVVRPVLYYWYVRRNYSLPIVKKDDSVLSQKWTGLGQHIAYFLHTNTDVVILTLFADLKIVSVYSIYSLVITSIRNITSSFSGGMEAVFGEMIARNEQTTLKKVYRRYKALLSTITIILFGVTAIMIVPFVSLYTVGITDIEYIQPEFAMILLFAEAINCLVLPCSTLPISANKLRETRWGAYGEAILNITLSCALVFLNPLVGVAVGTLVAAFFKSIFYMMYATKNILKINFKSILLQYILTLGILGTIGCVGIQIIQKIDISNFLIWGVIGCTAVLCVGGVSLMFNYILYPLEIKKLANSLLRKLY